MQHNQKRLRGEATRRVVKRSRARRKNDNRPMILLICGVFIIFSVVICINIFNGTKTLTNLKNSEKKLQAQYEEQLEISKELKKKEVYVKTNAYIEEQARKMGLVYPDEVIFKPEEK